LFTKVLKKFFTWRAKNENKVETYEVTLMLTYTQIKTVASRSRDTFFEDAAGVCALTIILIVALHLSGPV
jgi:hypothetical protein